VENAVEKPGEAASKEVLMCGDETRAFIA